MTLGTVKIATSLKTWEGGAAIRTFGFLLALRFAEIEIRRTMKL